MSRPRVRLPVSKEPLLVALVLVIGVSPFATDTYIAALPDVRRSLETSSGTAQLTMTAFILGLAAGQFVCGPISDGRGRRGMLIWSCAAFALLSAACAVAPGAGLLLTARALQGFAGGCGVAVGRAVVSDRYTGADAAARYGTLAAVTLLAPILAPAVGGVILQVGDWRTVFVFLTVLGITMTLGVLVGIPETLAPSARSAAGLAATTRRMRGLLGRRNFVTVVAVQCLSTSGFFVYIGGSSIILQGQLGLSPGQYTVLFATNAAAMAATSLVFRLSVRRVGSARLRTTGLAISTIAVLTLTGYAWSTGGDVSLAPTWILLSIVVAGMGLSIPATTAIAQEIGRDAGGTASALLGGLTFGVGAAATPLTGLTGRTTVTGMATIMAVFFVCAVVVLLTIREPRPTRSPAP